MLKKVICFLLSICFGLAVVGCTPEGKEASSNVSSVGSVSSAESDITSSEVESEPVSSQEPVSSAIQTAIVSSSAPIKPSSPSSVKPAAPSPSVTTSSSKPSTQNPVSPPSSVAPAAPAKPSATVSKAPEVQEPAQTTPQSQTVWVSKTGKKYHSNPNCSNMKNPIKMTLDEAKASGRTPCKNCY